VDTGPALRTDALRRAGWLLLCLSAPSVAVASVLDPHGVGAAAAQDWPPFVLVTGLLALGLVARDDGLFDAAGSWMAGKARGGRSLFVGAAVLVALVTAVLNLDTSVAFLTPVLVVAARRRGVDELPFLYLAVFLANGASLLLPGSNLTNLIVLGHAHETGADFARHMALPWAAAVVTVTVVVGTVWRAALGRAGSPVRARAGARLGVSLLGVAIVVVAMIVLAPAGEALVALATGTAAAGWSLGRGRITLVEVRETLNVPVLAGLFGVAVGLGTLGRVWSGPEQLLGHASSVVAAVVGAASSVVVNNLPAASLLAARAPAQPHALLIGLDLGPNLAVSGALSAILWLQVSRVIGADARVSRYSKLGAVVVPASMAAALAALALAH
jgi:arsenical pump membrane protein